MNIIVYGCLVKNEKKIRVNIKVILKQVPGFDAQINFDLFAKLILIFFLSKKVYEYFLRWL